MLVWHSCGGGLEMVLGSREHWIQYTFHSCSMEQNSNSKTINKPSWYLMQRGRFGEAWLGWAGSEKRQQWECERLGKMD